MRWLVVSLLLAGCGYQSQYAPPLDGRARPLWVENKLRHNLNDVPLPPGCTDQMAWLLIPEAKRPRGVVVVPMIAVAVWLHRPLPLLRPQNLVSPLPGWRALPFRSSRDEFGWLRSIGMVLSVVAMPVSAITLASIRPELSEDSVEAIDQVNAYNDLARSAGSACAWVEAPPPPEVPEVPPPSEEESP